MEDNINMLANRKQPQFFGKWNMTSTISKWETTKIFWQMEDTSNFKQMEDELNILIILKTFLGLAQLSKIYSYS